jgi:hypothetical protein
VAKLADARDLKSRVSKETYRFDSGPGHHLSLAVPSHFTVTLPLHASTSGGVGSPVQ